MATLLELRTQAKQRADMVNSQFITDPEWTTYLNGSAAELYDLLVAKYGEDYFMAEAVATADGSGEGLIQLPDDFYKLRGVELQYSGTPTGWVTLRQFNFQDRNRMFPNAMPATPYGIVDMRYRVNGGNLHVTPAPGAGQTLRIWYVPRISPLVNETDTLDGVSGWEEYVVVDAAIKALTKEESDVSVFMAQKGALIHRIESAAANRDTGSPATVQDIRDDGGWGGWGMGGGMF